MALRLTQRLVQAHLGDYTRVITPDATASTYGSLTDLMGGCTFSLKGSCCDTSEITTPALL